MSDRREPSGRARTVFHDFEAHSGLFRRKDRGQREIGEKWTALPTGAVDQSQVRQAPRVLLLHHPPLSPREDPSITRRKALRDSALLRPLLSRYDFVLHGHTHKNTALVAANTRIFGTASGSAGNASFRQFDVVQMDNGWQISMQLHQLSNGEVTQVDAQTWTRKVDPTAVV